MQPAALPDLAHTHARPVHWLATAAAMAAVVAGAGLLQPDAATATSARGPQAAPKPAPDAATATYPLECGGGPSKVSRQVTGDLDGDGNPETVAEAHCDAGSGTPPSGIYVLTRGKDGAARVVATLVEPAVRQSVEALAVRDGAVTATLLGYSNPDVPSCCPDLKESAEWRWRDGTFVRASAGPAAQSA